MDQQVEKYLDIRSIVSDLVNALDEITDIKEKVNTLNYIRERLHESSPFKNHPTDLVLWVEADKIESNAYNPNRVAPPEEKLLFTSMQQDGVTMPTYVNPEVNGMYETIDGFHRTKQIKFSKEIRESTLGYVPVTIPREGQREISDRMASTIRHNRARGSHEIDLMVNIVGELTKSGMGDHWIMKHIGMDKDELLRLKQISGLAELFANRDFSESIENDHD